MLSQKQKKYFYFYNFLILFTPIILLLIGTLIPQPDLSHIRNPHAFEYISDGGIAIVLIIVFGLYLYPLHLIFINKTTLQIPKKLFIGISITCITFYPLFCTLMFFSPEKYIIPIGFIILIFILPFLIIYYIKYKLHNLKN